MQRIATAAVREVAARFLAMSNTCTYAHGCTYVGNIHASFQNFFVSALRGDVPCTCVCSMRALQTRPQLRTPHLLVVSSFFVFFFYTAVPLHVGVSSQIYTQIRHEATSISIVISRGHADRRNVTIRRAHSSREVWAATYLGFQWVSSLICCMYDCSSRCP